MGRQDGPLQEAIRAHRWLLAGRLTYRRIVACLMLGTTTVTNAVGNVAQERRFVTRTRRGVWSAGYRFDHCEEDDGGNTAAEPPPAGSAGASGSVRDLANRQTVGELTRTPRGAHPWRHDSAEPARQIPSSTARTAAWVRVNTPSFQ